MRILKASPNTPSFEENAYSMLKKAVSEDRVEWQLLPSEQPSADDTHIFTYAGFIKLTKMHSLVSGQVHSIIIKVSVSIPMQEHGSIKIEVLLNRKRSMSIADHTKINTLAFMPKVKNIERTLANILSSEFGITKFPRLSEKEINLNFPDKIRLTRAKSKYYPATELIISVVPVPLQGYSIVFVVNNLETGETGTDMKIADNVDPADVWDHLNDVIEKRGKANGYVDESSMAYIPEGANPGNFDFVVNVQKGTGLPTETPTEVDVDDEPIGSGIKFRSFANSGRGWYKVSQDYEGYFSGDIPDSAANMWGTSAVDASQIKSMFGKADEAIKLVNQFDSSLLSPVSFIFNFGKTGAYGVYLSELDRAIKTKALRKQLESRGYKIEVNDRGLLTAYPTREDKRSEEIQQDIDNLYGEIQSKGSTAFGINMNAILNSSKEDASAMNSPDPNVWEWIAILHLGETITHEAIHAKGATDEGTAYAGGSKFVQFALPLVNREYQASLKSQNKEDMFTPIVTSTATRHAQKHSWYRKAQSYMAMPQSIMNMPFGSDLSGRFPTGVQTNAGMAMWGMISQQNANIPIENKLSRQYMSPLSPDINLNKDSIEDQLRKSTRYVKRIGPKVSMEEALSEGHDPNRGYLTLEQLLDENRIKPLIVPLKKNASMVRTATLFGWMNNLQISDGSTIPGLGDRVMAWDDRDEDFAEEESWIRKQPRYNPEYDIKGFYYRWIEPRFQPQLFNDMTRDYSGTHPAKRFASIDDGVDKILSVFSTAKQKIISGEISGTRFIMTKDILPLVEKVFDSCGCQISIFYTQTDGEEDIYSVWVYASSVSEEDIEKIERHFQKKDVGQEKEIMGMAEKVVGIGSQKQNVIGSVLKAIERICCEYGIGQMSFDKELQILDNGTIVVNFNNLGKDMFLKIGSLLAESLGSRNPHMEPERIVFVYKGYQISMTNNKESSDGLVQERPV